MRKRSGPPAPNGLVGFSYELLLVFAYEGFAGGHLRRHVGLLWSRFWQLWESTRDHCGPFPIC
eukprot:6930580-Pyramimonas_sp.AAC.1